MKGLLFFILGATITTNAVAGGCDWATETPADDGKYKYFVAKSYSESSASDAANKAEQDIDAQLGRLFGTKLDIQSEYYSDETGASGTMRSYERALGAITLKGLERQKSDVVKESKAWVGCVQYRYLKSEINKEKKRIENLSPGERQKSLIFNESVGDSTCVGAPVEITTTPSGAYVSIDNGKYRGTSPMKFGNVCNGKHTLKIAHDNYESVSEKLIVPTSGRIEKTLKRATKQITVKTTLGNSEIEINGVNWGLEPVVFYAPLGIEHTFTTTNKESGKITRVRSFSKDSDSEYIISMEKLPGKINFCAFLERNPGVVIYVDEKKQSSCTTKEISAETHNLVFKKDGFVDKVYNLYVHGGETTYYPDDEMEFSTETIMPKQWLTYWSYGIGVSLGNMGLNFDASLEKAYGNFYYELGLHLSFIGMDSIEYTDYSSYYRSYDEEEIQTLLEYGFIDVGFAISDKLSLFGTASIGTFDSVVSKTIIRYGLGIRYLFSGLSGVKLSYKTGDTDITAEDVYDYVGTRYDIEDMNIPKKISTFNITGFWRF